jgi:hypothetical protein
MSVSTLTCAFASAPGSATAPSRITQKIDSRNLAALAHNVRRELNATTDLGPVEDTLTLPRMHLILQRSPEQQAALTNLIERQHQQTAPEFHQWLTPAQFGEKFGASQQDIAAVTDWLTAQGFSVHAVMNNNSMIEFSGTAANVRESFHTQLHYLDLNGKGLEGHIFANAQDPSIPAALAPVVAGITGLHNIPLRANHTKVQSASFNQDTHTWHRNGAPRTPTAVKPDYSDNEGDYFISPQDYYTIYNVNPLFTAGTHGASATIAVVEQSDMAYGTVTSYKATGGDVSTFRNLFGVPGTLNMYVYHGYGSATCADPGIRDGDESEATLDAEWATALAPSAKLIYMSCSETDNGVIQSLTALIDNNLADAMSMSYGSSELGYAESDYTQLDTLYSQAATQGQSVFVSTGDSGSDVADQNTSGVATSGINVSALSSSPYVTATGGTDFSDYYDANQGGGPSQATYWNTSNSVYYGDAKSYVPEMSWNDSCAGSIFANFADNTTPAAFCALEPTDTRGDSYLFGDVVGGSGGFSTHYAAPSYQTGITGFSGTRRAQPDISMNAANGFWGHALIFCDSDISDPEGDPDGNCTSTDTFGLAGGTSFVAPAVAGIAGLLVDYTGSRQGVLNYGLYALAKTQFTASATKSSCYSNGQTSNTGVTTGLPISSCIFNDVTTGNNDEGCEVGGENCYVNSGASYGVLSTTTSPLTIAYPSTVGYDEVTGIGTLNVTNLVSQWKTAFSTTTKLTASATSITTSQSTTLTATVTGATPAGYTGKAPTLAGSVTFYSGSTSIGTCTLASGTCNISVSGSTLGSGSHSITATFIGSSAYPTSTSSAVTVTVTGGSVSTTTAVTATPSTATFGQSVALKATVTASSGTAAGSVSFATGSTQLGSCTLAAATCTVSTTALPLGTETVTATYTPGSGFSASTGTVSVTVNKASTATSVTATPTSAAFGASVSLKATVTSTGGTPTGTISFTTGSTTLGSCTLASGTCTVSTTALPVGSDSVKATYAGSTDFATGSGTATVTIAKAASTTTLTITPNPAASGAALTFKATVTAASGTPTGSISLSYSGTVFGSCNLSAGTCSVPLLVNLPAGTYSVEASYAGATDYGTSSGTKSVTITKAATTTTLVITPNPATPAQSLKLTATVKRPAGYTGVPTGTVNFYYSTLLLGSGTVNSAGVATYTQPAVNLPAGTYSLTATYSDDGSDNASSGTASVTIN